VFFKLIEQCNMEITLAIQAQNLTSEVKEGSLAAAREHGDVKQTLLQSKARGFCRTLYTQLARPFAALNYGRPEIAPRPKWDIKPVDDKKTLALALLNLAQSLNYLRVAGKQVKDVRALAAQFGLDLGELEDVVPLQVDVATARVDGTTPPVKSDSTSDDESDDKKNENEN
jgi:phage gp29-like protein